MIDLQKPRFIVNPNAEVTTQIKATFHIDDEDETILIVLDDSLFTILGNIVVFTNRRIYWNKKNVCMKVINDNSETITNGFGSIDITQLKNVSILTNKNTNDSTIYLIGETIWLAIPFRFFAFDESLKIVFYNYLSNYSGGYVPYNIEHEALFQKFLKEYKKGASVAAVFDVASFAAIGILLLAMALLIKNSVLPEKIKEGNIIFGILVFSSLLFKLLSILSGNNKSVYLNLFLIITVSCIVLIHTLLLLYFPSFSSFEPVEIFYFLNKVFQYTYIGYAGFMILINIFNCNKITKLVLSVLAIFALVFLARAILHMV